MTESVHAAKPWISPLSEAQRAHAGPVATLVHAFRDCASAPPEREAPVGPRSSARTARNGLPRTSTRARPRS